MAKRLEKYRTFHPSHTRVSKYQFVFDECFTELGYWVQFDLDTDYDKDLLVKVKNIASVISQSMRIAAAKQVPYHKRGVAVRNITDISFEACLTARPIRGRGSKPKDSVIPTMDDITESSTVEPTLLHANEAQPAPVS